MATTNPTGSTGGPLNFGADGMDFSFLGKNASPMGKTPSYTANGTVPLGTNTSTNPYTSTNTNPVSALGFGLNSNMWQDLTKVYGGLGTAINNFLVGGSGYNPQVLQALINQIQPQVNTGIADLQASTGAAGTRFGSGYEVGLGDYLSQVNNNENTMASGLYQDSVQNTMNILGQVSNPIAQHNNNKGGFWSSLLSGLLGGSGVQGALGGMLNSVIGMIPGLGGGSNSGGNINNSGINLGDWSGGWGGMTIDPIIKNLTNQDFTSSAGNSIFDNQVTGNPASNDVNFGMYNANFGQDFTTLLDMLKKFGM